MMSPAMRARLARNIDYHAAMAEHHRAEDKKEKEAHPTPPQGRGAPKPPESANERLAAMHDDVVKQLVDLLNADPAINAVEEAQRATRPLRDPAAGQRPDAGWFMKPTMH